jgi:leucyl aminopeptidase
MHPAFVPASAAAIPITIVTKSGWEAIGNALPHPTRQFAKASDFGGRPGQCLIVPDAEGRIVQVLFGVEDASDAGRDPFRAGQLPNLLPPGTYRLANAPHDARLAALAFALGTYRFGRYRKAETPAVHLALPEDIDGADISRMVQATAMARDLINTPANDMGPQELEDAVRKLASAHGASVRVTAGDDLLRDNFPLIHAVGRASTRAPRLIDMTWGGAAHPKVTLVGKGVCFDTGGLDLKPSSSMLLMKKDMGGAASVLALAQMIMDAKLKVRLRVLIPAVENSVSGNAFRPLDVYPSRKGITVEIGNTDAEGRLVLADALAYACEENPDLLIDMGTLTGAARVALGPELPPFYTRDEQLAADVSRVAFAENDPLWRLPLWAPYDSWLEGKTGSINHIAANGFAGSIVCALFLQRFVEPATKWLHLDIYGWSTGRPGRPEGGECQGARALYRLLAERHG